MELRCRPSPDSTDPVTGKKLKPEELPTHRFPSTATPSFYVPPPLLHTEDDVLYREHLPSFESTAHEMGQLLGQRDSEMLISFLTVPYLRLPVVLTFFATEDRVHKLLSPELRGILDSVLFEPGKYLSLDMGGVEPLMVPSPHAQVGSSFYYKTFILLLEFPLTYLPSTRPSHGAPAARAAAGHAVRPAAERAAPLAWKRDAQVPASFCYCNFLNLPAYLLPTCNFNFNFNFNVMRSVLSLCTSALAVDTGCVVDEGAKDFNASTDILLYVARLCARVDNYVCFLLDHALNRHDCIVAGLREVSVAPATVAALHDGLAAMRAQLRGAFAPLLEDYLARLHEQTARDPTNEKLIDRNSRLAADLHAHKVGTSFYY
jgi:hypothetical protein